MAVVKLYDLARMTTATVGTGTITLSVAVAPYLSFNQAGVQNGDLVRYAIYDPVVGGSEIGTGIYTASGTTLTRNPTTSTNSNTAINLSGAAQVFITSSELDFQNFSLVNIAPNALSNNQGFVVTQTSPTSGAVASPLNFNYINVTNLGGASTGGFTRGAPNPFVSGERIDYFTSGSSTASTFQTALYAGMNVTGNNNSSTVLGVFGTVYINGTNANTTAGAFGVDGYSIVDGSGNIGSVSGIVGEVGIRSGGVAQYRSALFLDNVGAVQGATLDAAIMVTSFESWNGSSSAGRFQNLFALTAFAGDGGAFPLSSTANIFTSDTTTSIGSFLNLPNVTFNSWLVNIPTVTITGAGQSNYTGIATLSSTTADSYFNIFPTITVAGNNQSIQRIAGSITGTNTVGMFGVNVGVTISPTVSGTITATSAAQYFAIHNPGSGTTITTAYGADIVLGTGSGSGAITTGYAIGLLPVYGSIKPTTVAGAHISNFGAAGITTSYGLQIDAQSGSTTNHGIVCGGDILSTATSGVGYATGAGGAVTQGTSRATGVTLNAPTGAITLFNTAGSATPNTFTVTNSAVNAADVIVLNQKSGTDKYELFVTANPGGSFNITFFTTGGTTTEQPVFSFAVIKGATS